MEVIIVYKKELMVGLNRVTEVDRVETNQSKDC